MYYEKEIPFGAFDSELMHQEINIPEGFEATIDGDKIILTRTEIVDDEIRKELLRIVKENKGSIYISLAPRIKSFLISLLEKQGEKKPIIDMITPEESLGIDSETYNKIVDECIYGEQKPINKIETKFKVGDWITDGQLTCKVLGIIGKSYELHLHNDDYCHFETDVQSVDKHYHLWKIKDAKDGDILTSIGFHNNCTFIFKGLDNWKFDEPNGDRAVATGYCCLSASADNMEFGIQGPDCIEVNTIKPATKIQRDLLFQKMKESGYEWDAENKELKKIEQKPAWSEDDDDDAWMNDIISKIENNLQLNKVEIDWLKSLKQRIGGKL